MDNRSRDRMRVDRRLLGRPGWIAPDELERELSGLPDVADKIDSREQDPSGEAPEPAARGEASPAGPDDDLDSSRVAGVSGSGEPRGEFPSS